MTSVPFPFSLLLLLPLGLEQQSVLLSSALGAKF
jgi:hypothetical protein